MSGYILLLSNYFTLENGAFIIIGYGYCGDIGVLVRYSTTCYVIQPAREQYSKKRNNLDQVVIVKELALVAVPPSLFLTVTL